jgi:hypothetical protein
MPPPRERRWRLVAAGYAVFVTLVAGGSAPVYYLEEPANRPLVIRLASALIVGVVVVHLVKAVRERLDAQAPSQFELALEPRRHDPSLDRHFVEIRNDLHYGVASGGYFERVLWPELVALVERSPHKLARERLVRPRGRSFRRGPSLTTLRRLIEAIEEATR